MTAPVEYPLVYRWRLQVLWGPAGSPYFGRACRVLAQGSKNSILIEFDNGDLAVVSRHAVRLRDLTKTRRQGSLFPTHIEY